MFGVPGMELASAGLPERFYIATPLHAQAAQARREERLSAP